MTYAKGKITVRVSGMYFIYAQLSYDSPTDFARHLIYVNRQIVALGHGVVSKAGPQTIYTSALRYLNVGDTISVKLPYGPTTVWVGPSETFFGAFMV